jgi:hypothetical protein
VSRSFNRRRALAAFGSVSLGALIAACGSSDGDSTTDVSTTDGGTTTVEPKTDSCEPLKNAVVDLWHCDALGSYSGFEAASGGGPGGGGRTDDEKYLRGAQVTNADGIVEFVTVYPGWYQGRTVHIHGKVHVDNQTALTTQFFFDDKVSERVYESSPYSQRSGRDVLNDNDNIFDESLLLDLSREGEGYLGGISLDVRSA